MTVITLSDLSAEIEWKAIKNVHLTIYPPDARIHVSAPLAMTEDAVRLFLITKLPWIRQRVSQILCFGRKSLLQRTTVSFESRLRPYSCKSRSARE